MPDFLHPGLLAIGLPILAAPILIHLINLMRHRRVEWAAMEFLLESQKKNSTWILIKQLLLLLLRMLAVAAVVFLVAQPLLRNEWGKLLGGAKTHHIVLLDDSFSMSDHWADTSAFDRAKQFAANLASQAARRAEPQTLTLVRFSRAGALSRGRPPDFLKESVGSDLAASMEGKLRAMEPSQTGAGPGQALESIEQLLGESDGESRIVYVVSDFRAREWNDAAALNKTLAKLNATEVQIRLINCVDAARPNLAVTSLKPGPGTRAAGVPLDMEVAVTNYGVDPARQVAVKLQEDGRDRAGLLIEEIAPGRTETQRFPVNFPVAGEHKVSARIESDAVEADNVAWSAVEFPVGIPVLVVDGNPDGKDGYFLSSAMNPGTVKTGLSPQVELPRYLNNNPLERFHSIYLVNVDRIDPPGVEALEKYVQDGGGVAFFLGTLSNGKFINEQLYRNGEGLFPAPVAGPTDLLVNRLDRTADLEVADHPIFRIFAGERNSFLGDVAVQRYFSLPDAWSPPKDSTVQVIARLRNKAPLAVERQFGAGRVLAFFTTAAPVWNNWGQNPSYVVVVQELQAYLASARPAAESRTVGTPLALRLDPAKYQPQLRWIAPGEDKSGGVTIEATVEPDGMTAVLPDTDAAGVYQLDLAPKEGPPQNRLYAYNVPPTEGNLKVVTGEQLAARLKGVKYEYQPSESFQFGTASESGFNLSEGLLYLMVLLLLGEQVLAYATSYHPPSKAGVA